MNHEAMVSSWRTRTDQNIHRCVWRGNRGLLQLQLRRLLGSDRIVRKPSEWRKISERNNGKNTKVKSWSFTVWNSRSDRRQENVPAPRPSCCGSPCTPDTSAGWGLFLNTSHPAGKTLPSALASSPSSSPSGWIGGSHLRRVTIFKSLTVPTFYYETNKELLITLVSKTLKHHNIDMK